MLTKKMKFKLPDRSFMIALLGIAVEYYEYTLFGFSAAVIANNFFPQDPGVDALLYTFGLFSIGYLAKLFGALIFGYVGDKYGRVVALRISMIGIAIPTTLISVLPTYAMWGTTSIVILLICRLLQGIFIAGEHDGVSIYILERVSPKRACFANSLIGLCYNIGIYFAAFSVALTQLPNLPEWAWRLPFLFGGMLGFISLYARQFLNETAAFSQHLKEKSLYYPLKIILQDNSKKFVCSILVFGSIGSMYHFYIIFWHTYLHKILGTVDLSEATLLTSIIVFLHIILKPIMGLLGDKKGVHSLMYSGVILMLLTNIYNMYQIHTQQIHYFSLFLIALSLSLFTVSGYVYLIRLFVVNHRYRILSLAHAIASCLFSGTIPVLCTWLWQITQNGIMPLLYLSIFPLLIYWVIRQEA